MAFPQRTGFAPEPPARSILTGRSQPPPMVFSSTIFLYAFLPAVLAFYYCPWPGGRRWRNSVLLAASLLFYAWGEPWFILILLAEVAVNWLCSLGIARSSRRRPRIAWAAAAIGLDVGVLFLFKYLGFVHRNWLNLTGSDAPPIRILLPIGISFFTFQIISYVVDVYRHHAQATKRIDDLCLYVAMFPQLIAGPIVRYASVAEAILKRRESWNGFSAGATRFVMGLGKKTLVANYVAIIADNVFLMAHDGAALSAGTAWLGIFAYSLQIYFDFSGYSDMAIGLGLMFGFRFDENFAHPYAATSITDFWRRWHISLSTWFRDYVYIPLGGNRRSGPRATFNLVAVWALTGFWHGANWTFLAWGLAYAAALLVERRLGLAKSKAWGMRLWTLLVVILCWVLFRSDSLADALNYYACMFGRRGPAWDSVAQSYLVNGWPVLLAAAILSLPVAVWLRGKMEARHNRIVSTSLDILSGTAYALVFLLSILACLKSTYNPFIYFNF